MKRMFTMKGQTYTSMAEIARELGVARVRPSDFTKYGIEEVTGEPTSTSSNLVNFPVSVSDTVDTPVDDNKDSTSVDEPVSQDTEEVEDDAQQNMDDEDLEEVEEVQTEDAKDPQTDDTEDDEQETQANEPDEPKVDKRCTRKLGTPEQVQQVQDSIPNMTLAEFSSFVSHFSVEALETLAETAGVNLWDSITNVPIRKMRLLMELKAHYYPNDKTPVKHASGWKKLTLDELLKVAADNQVEYKTSDNLKIQRMWVTQELKKAGLNPEDYIQKPDDQEDKKNA